MLSKSSRTTPNQRHGSEGGFSLLEMVVAMIVLTVGLLGVASAIGYALMASNRGKGITNSKMLVVEALEQMETLRDTNQLTFEEISNTRVATVEKPFTGFPTTFLPVTTTPGPDDIFGTADDLINAGPNGTYGNSDDFTDPSLARPGVTRQILITDFAPTNPFLKKIQVTLRYYPNGGEMKEMVGKSYLNDDSHGTYVP